MSYRPYKRASWPMAHLAVVVKAPGSVVYLGKYRLTAHRPYKTQNWPRPCLAVVAMLKRPVVYSRQGLKKAHRSYKSARPHVTVQVRTKSVESL